MRGLLAAALVAALGSPASAGERERLQRLLAELRTAADGLRFKPAFGAGPPGCPPFDGPVRLLYLPGADGVEGSCGEDGGAQVAPDEEGNPAVALLCALPSSGEEAGGWSCEASGYQAVVGAGRSIWDVGEVGDDAGALESRVGCILAHELGHVALWHPYEIEAAVEKLYKAWWGKAGSALFGRLYLKELRRRAPGRDQVLPASELREVDEEARQEADEAFEAAHESKLAAVVRASEDDADRYARALLARTRLDEGECANLHLHLAWQEAADAALPAVPASSTHESDQERAWRHFWRGFAGDR